METQIVFIIGPPLSGKSTLGWAIREEVERSYPDVKIKMLSSGDIVRGLAEQGQQEVIRALAEGRLAPPAVMDPLARSYLLSLIDREDPDLVIVEGYPRYADQLLDVFTAFPRYLEVAFIILHAPPDVIRARAKTRLRADDDLATLQIRLEQYQSSTAPIEQWLRTRSHIPSLEIDFLSLTQDAAVAAVSWIGALVSGSGSASPWIWRRKKIK